MAKTNNEKRDNKVVASSIENNEKVNATVAAVAIPEGAKEIENENLTISEPGVYVTKGCAKDAILTIESIAKDAHDKTIVTGSIQFLATGETIRKSTVFYHWKKAIGASFKTHSGISAGSVSRGPRVLNEEQISAKVANFDGTIKAAAAKLVELISAAGFGINIICTNSANEPVEMSEVTNAFRANLIGVNESAKIEAKAREEARAKAEQDRARKAKANELQAAILAGEFAKANELMQLIQSNA